MADYSLSVLAVDDLQRIYDFSLEQFGDVQATAYLMGLEETFMRLAARPTTAPAVDDIRPGYRRCIYEQHAIYFRVDGNDIYVVRILNHRMLPPLHL